MDSDVLTTPSLLRAEQLRNAGLPYRSISVILELDYGIEISTRSLSKHLRARGCPPDYRHGRPFGHGQPRPQDRAAA